MNIEAKNLSKIYGDGENRVVALDHANLEIVSSDFISIMGSSGSGKSTLLHLLSGLDKPSSGSLTYDGKDIYSYSDKELSAFRRKRIGFIFQQFNLLPVLTAKENIIMPLLLDKQKPEGPRPPSGRAAPAYCCPAAAPDQASRLESPPDCFPQFAEHP